MDAAQTLQALEEKCNSELLISGPQGLNGFVVPW